MIKVKEVVRTKSVEVTDGEFFVSFGYNNDAGKLTVLSRGQYKNRQTEPVYIPKPVFNSFVKRAYAVFYDSKKKKRVSPDQLQFKLGA